MIYKRGRIYWYEFSFQGQRIRESSHTNSKTIARDAEWARQRDLGAGHQRRRQALAYNVSGTPSTASQFTKGQPEGA